MNLTSVSCLTTILRLGKRDYYQEESARDVCSNLQIDWIKSNCGFQIGYQTMQKEAIELLRNMVNRGSGDQLEAEPSELDVIRSIDSSGLQTRREPRSSFNERASSESGWARPGDSENDLNSKRVPFTPRVG